MMRYADKKFIKNIENQIFLKKNIKKKSEHIFIQNHMKKHQKNKKKFQITKWIKSYKQSVNKIYKMFCLKNYTAITSARKWFNFNHEKFIMHEKFQSIQITNSYF